jgi:hypothetical protein
MSPLPRVRSSFADSKQIGFIHFDEVRCEPFTSAGFGYAQAFARRMFCFLIRFAAPAQPECPPVEVFGAIPIFEPIPRGSS